MTPDIDLLQGGGITQATCLIVFSSRTPKDKPSDNSCNVIMYRERHNFHKEGDPI